MIKALDIGALMELNKTNNLRVFDSRNQKILDITETSPMAAFEEFKKYIPLLEAYQRVTVKAADDSAAKSHFTNALSWLVTFEGTSNNTQTQVATTPMNSTQTNELYQAKLELEKLKQKNEYDERFRKLEEQINGKDEMDKYIKYVPFVGKIMGWNKTEMMEMLQLSYAADNMSKVAGANTTLSLSGSEQDMNAEIESIMNSLATKIPAEKMLFLLKAIDKQPAIIDQAILLIKQYFPQLAGAPEQPKEQPNKEPLETFKIDENFAIYEEVSTFGGFPNSTDFLN